MVKFNLNGNEKLFDGDENLTLLKYLRETEGLISVKDGCSCGAYCGSCMVELNGKAVLSCITPMSKVDGCNIETLEGFPPELKETLGKAFVEKGAVQCGFCTPGFLTRTKILLRKNPNPTRKEIIQALEFNVCRCTGYIKIIEAIEFASAVLRKEKNLSNEKQSGKIGTRRIKYGAYETAVGERPFTADLKFDGMLHSALKFSAYPRARVLKIDCSKAEKSEGVIRIFTAKDIPGKKKIGHIVPDWDVMIAEGEITRYIGDVIAGVVAETEEQARNAVEKIKLIMKFLNL